MRHYEVAFIIHPDQDEASVKDLIAKVQGWIKDAGGSIHKVDVWGKRKMAYAIRKQKEGQYVFVQAEFEPALCGELERNLRLQESVMRFMLTAMQPAPAAE
jgi:small subunit ribosomal protein S6